MTWILWFGPYAKHLVTNLWCYWEAIESSQGWPSGRKLVIWHVTLKVLLGTLLLFLPPSMMSLSLSPPTPPHPPLPSHHKMKVNSFALSHVFCHDVLPQNSEVNQTWMKPLKPWAKINLSSFQVVYLRYFGTVTGSWLTQ
jgi:hypothetical protein